MTGHRCLTGWHAVPAAGCYQHHRCRCQGCTVENRRQGTARREAFMRAGLHDGWVDAAPITALIRMLRSEYGASLQWIAAQTGQSRQNVGFLAAGRRRHVRLGLARRVSELARRVGAGEVRPAGVAGAHGRKLERDRRRLQRRAVA